MRQHIRRMTWALGLVLGVIGMGFFVWPASGPGVAARFHSARPLNTVGNKAQSFSEIARTLRLDTLGSALFVPIPGWTGTFSGAVSTATGRVVVTNQFSFEIYLDANFTGLLGTSSAAHIHCCAAAGTNAGVAVTTLNAPLGVTSGSFSRGIDLTDASVYQPSFLTANGGTAAGARAALLAGLNAGQAYVDIHSSIFPGGEIRAQLAPCASNPDATITAATSVCTLSTGNTAWVPSAGAGATYNWFIQGGTIVSGQGTPNITWTAGVAGTASVFAFVANELGCSATDSKEVTVNAAPVSSIIGADAVCSSTGGNQYGGPGGASSYSWMISGDGTISSATTGQFVSVTAGSAGSFTLSLTVSNSLGCFSTSTKIVTISPGTACEYEADVAPRPSGDRTMVVSDWVQAGRFSVGLDVPVPGSETQRADCAPRANLGDGRITVADWVQAGRYSVALDPLTQAGGATQISQASPNNAEDSGKPRELRIASRVVWSGQEMVSVPVELVAQGGENGLTFSIQFDPEVLSYEGSDTGRNAGSEAELIVRIDQAPKGRLGIGLALRPGQRLSSGITELMTVKFKLRNPSATTTGLEIGDGPTDVGLADVRAGRLSVKPVAGVISIRTMLTLTQRIAR